jgi:ABC-2 type transport system ATP-binding protein
VKRYGDTVALDGLDLEVATGTVLGMLGPNGAGKTTAVRILTTLLRPDAGTATVGGIDVVAEPARVRSRIGLTGQYAAVDEHLTGHENVTMIGRLAGLGKHQAAERADDLLARFGLGDAAHRPSRGYSGGMRRRLDLAASLTTSPDVVFLDEPTTGLDPGSRLGLWDVIREVVAHGTTVLLTTQYLEEADVLADEILVIDHGREIARGTATELKSEVGGETVAVELQDAAQLQDAASALATVTRDEIRVEEKQARLSFPAHGDTSRLAATVRALDEAGIAVADLALRRPSLDDVFLSLTGHAASDSATTTSSRT